MKHGNLAHRQNDPSALTFRAEKMAKFDLVDSWVFYYQWEETEFSRNDSLPPVVGVCPRMLCNALWRYLFHISDSRWNLHDAV